MAKTTEELERIVNQQSELIKQLKIAISRLERRTMAIDKKASRAAEVGRKATINITNISRTIKGLRSD